METPNAQAALSIIYDGECPFCSAYVKMLRLKQTFGSVNLVDARAENPIILKARQLGIKPNKGVIVHWQDSFLQADEAMHFLALASQPDSLLSRLYIWIFRYPRLVKLIYPALYQSRNLALRLLGRRQITE